MHPAAICLSDRLITAAAALSVLFICSLPATATGQQTSAVKPARLTGLVVAGDTGRPLSASVRLLGGAAPVAVHTDENGSFEVAATPGSYLITAVTAGYVLGIAGQRTPNEPPTLFALASGESRHVEIGLTPLGRIAGTVLDAGGRPAPGVEVHALRQPAWSCASPTGTPLPIGLCRVAVRAVTDAGGRYQLDGLRAGAYHLLALGPAGAGAPTPANRAPQSGSSSKPVTYYPGTAFPNQATTIAVTPGFQAEATFALADVGRSRVSGRILDSRGQPIGNAVAMLLARGPQVFSLLPRTAMLEPDGRFQLTDVPPGDYVLAVRDTSKYLAIAKTGGTVGEPFTGELADVAIRVPSDDLEGLAIVTRPGFDLSGTVTRDGRPTSNLGRAGVGVLPAGDLVASAIAGGSTLVAPDGTFVLRNLIGPQRIVVSPPPGAMVQRILAGGVDVTDDGVEMSGPVSIEVVLGTLSSLTGRVATRQGMGVPGMSVVAFAEDPRLWTLRDTRHVRVAAADLDGTFRIDGLPAGRYYVAAVPSTNEGQPEAPTDLDALDPLIPRASRVETGDGDRRSVVVTID